MAEEEVSASPPFDLLMSHAVPHMFSDGLAQLQIGYPVSSIFLYDVTIPPKTEGAKEQRRVNLVLQMPTVSLVEAARIILTAATEVAPQIFEAGSLQHSKLGEMLASASIKPVKS